MRGAPIVSGFDPSDEIEPGRRFQTLGRIARSWKLGLLLALIATIVVVSRVDIEEFRLVGAVSPAAILGSSISYAAGLLVLALAPAVSQRVDRRTIGSGMSAHLLKYVPGSIWQGQRLLATGGVAAVGRFVLLVVLSASGALLVSGHLWAILVGSVVATIAVWIGWRNWGADYVIGAIVMSWAVVLAIGLSGGILGAAMGMSFIATGRDIVSAWGLGVLVVPVPAGLGIRELYLSVAGTTGMALEVGVVHRLISLVADIVIGLVGLWVGSPARRGA